MRTFVLNFNRNLKWVYNDIYNVLVSRYQALVEKKCSILV